MDIIVWASSPEAVLEVPSPLLQGLGVGGQVMCQGKEPKVSDWKCAGESVLLTHCRAARLRGGTHVSWDSTDSCCSGLRASSG